MNKFILLSILSLLLSVSVPAFGYDYTSRWQAYPSYYTSREIVETGDEVFVLADGSLFSYQPDDNSIGEYGRITGFNDSGIAFADYDFSTKTLVIAYENENIDLFSDGDIHNIPDLKDKVMSADKSILNLQIQNGKGFLATAFGAVVIDLKKKEISDSYIFNYKTHAALEAYGMLLLFTTDGLYGCPLEDNAYDWSKWRLLNDYTFTSAAYFDGRLYAAKSNGDVVVIGEDWKESVFLPGYQSVKVRKNQLVCSSETASAVCTASAEAPRVIRHPFATAFSSVTPNTYWITTSAGLACYKSSGDDYVLVNEGIRPDSPIVKGVYNMHFAHGKLICTSGGPYRILGDAPGMISIFEEGSWSNITKKEVMEQSGYSSFDKLLTARFSPSNPDRFYISAFLNGVFVFENGKYKEHYTDQNSSMESNRWISALEFDAKGNLWALNSKAESQIKMQDNNGKWYEYGVSELNNIEALDRLLITKNGSRSQKWIIPCYKSTSGAVFDDNGTPETTSDDRSVGLKKLIDQDGNVFSSLIFRCLAEDQDGKVWLGTESGLFVFPSPQNIFSDNTSCTRIKVPRNDGSNLADFLFENECLTEILVDPANRKWVATSNNGLYLVSSDGLETLHHFTKENSPLFSDNILSLAFDPQSGDLYIGTDKGLMVYTSDAIEGKEDFSDVYAFPNPVRPEYTGNVVITGLMNNSLVKITDINNNLIYQGTSLGGQLTWDGYNSKGKRVNSGVYLVYATSESGKQGVVTKILFVN